MDEEAIRYFIQEKDLLTIPDWVQHYRFVKIPTLPYSCKLWVCAMILLQKQDWMKMV